MFFRRLLAVHLSASSLALATPYSAYNSFNAQLTRAFAVPETVTTYKRTTIYSSSSTLTNTPNARSSGPSSFNAVGPRAEGNSWAMPSRQAPFTWGPGAQKAPPDPVNTKMIGLILKAKASGKRPDLTKATELELYEFYVGFGVRRAEALSAALNDYREGTRLIGEARSAAQRKIDAYMAKEAGTRALHARELQTAKARALAAGDVATAQAWLDLAMPQGLWRGAFIEHNPKEAAAAIFHAAQRGIPKAIRMAWGQFRRDDPEGFIWRDRCVALGSLAAMDAAFTAYTGGAVTNYAAAAALFEKSYPQIPTTVAFLDAAYTQGAASARCAHALAQLYAQGDATLRADGEKALAWARRLPAFRQARWQEWGNLTRVNALNHLLQNPAVAQAVEKELLAEWLELARLEPASDTLDPRTQTVLAEIFSGTHPAFPTSKDPVRAEAAFRQVYLLAEKHFGAAIRLIQYCNRTGEWHRAGKTAEFEVAHANSPLAYELGLYWRDRTDGKADPARAIVYLEKARMVAPLGVIALAETYIKMGRFAEAEQAILDRKKYSLIGFDLFRAYAHLSLMQLRGDFGGHGSEQARSALVEARALLAKVTAPTAEQREYIRSFEFQCVAQPLLSRQEEFNRRDRALDAQLDEMALNPAKTPEEKKARADALAEIEDKRRINADYRREEFKEALPKLYAQALTGYEPAQRMWAWVALSGQVTISPEEAHTAKAFLYAAAKDGDLLSLSMLGQLLLQDGQRIQAGGSAPQETLDGLYAEAADWLEAARQNGAAEVLWPLVTVYRDGLGRPKSPEKVVVLLESLAGSGDTEARAQLGKARG
ncbi:MAG: hypothetical protein V4773_13195 [Verrucomicrobiota bacterium]